MSTQPEALRLADALMEEHPFPRDIRLAAAELRRQHDEVESLRQAYNIVTDDCRNLTEKVIPNIRAQRDALLRALKRALPHAEDSMARPELDIDILDARAAILAVEEGK